MADAIAKIVEIFPKFAVLTNICFILFLILEIADDFDKIKKFVKRIFDFRKHVDTLLYAKKRKDYNKTLYSDDFLQWQMKIMDKIYAPLIDEANEELAKEKSSAQIGITSLAFANSEEKPIHYESVTIRLKPVAFPFSGVCSKEHLERKKDISKEKYTDIQKKHLKLVKKYYRLVGSTIKYPNRLGYMLEDIVTGVGEDDWYLTSYCGNYISNLKTSHILEYELYLLYMKNKRQGLKVEDGKREDILKKLPIRNEIHKYFTETAKEKECNVLLSGRGRASLLGVQIFVMVKNHSGKYDTLRIRRSENVAAKPGFLQFIPSGGFEAMNDCTDYDAQWDNYSITKAVFREMLEECFGQDEDDKKAVGNNVSPNKIYSNHYVKEIMKRISDPEDGTTMQLLGSSMSLVGLRHELSFVLKIDDPELSSAFISNYESKTAIHMIEIGLLEDRGFWMEDDLKKLNCTSAALFELARGSEIYKQCL